MTHYDVATQTGQLFNCEAEAQMDPFQLADKKYQSAGIKVSLMKVVMRLKWEM